ncbi:peptide ABC transporter ATP-binding protein [Brevibacillus parabrevis]|uniref:ABC transporter ATP-binding protein n=1 Tax=Brevibacillus parabrevis TaxID=54914 RepID=UPI0007ABA2A0|nr:ABC transporter ATP-binding protein [Brevibacillus parabrevis]KZE49007.1 peptide ABC transporter ATP-binding protein [Brevibacillus parabrevis]
MLKVEGVAKAYKKAGLFSREREQVLSDIHFACDYGECLGIIGESGSGKSTLGRLVLGIEQPDRGSILFEGESVTKRRGRLGKISAVFQDYTSSINPFYTVEAAIMESLRLIGMGGQEASDKLDFLLDQVGLDRSYRQKHPHELSGGEVQRVCIARAVATNPTCIVLDEAISSLDGSVQMQVLQLLKQLGQAYRMSYLFITHDLQAAAYLCDRVMIVHRGRVVETVAVEQLKDVQSAYARKLLRMVML